MSIKEVLNRATKELKDVQEPGKSAEFLLQQVLVSSFRHSCKNGNLDIKVWMIANPDHKLTAKQEKKFYDYIERRKKHEPVWYITGHIEFCGLDLVVNENVLISRPETEFLVEEVLKSIKNKTKNISTSLSSRAKRSEVEGSLKKDKRKGFLSSSLRADSHFGRNDKEKDPSPSFKNDTIRILELGTGSGAIALALASEFKINNERFWTSQNDIKIYASDISSDALEVAKKNAKQLKLDKFIDFKQGDLLEPWQGEKFDILVANLPYIPHEEMDSLAFDIHHWEPRVALDGGKEGLEIYERFMAQARDYMNDSAVLFLEIGIEQGASIKKLTKKYPPKAKVQIKKDYSDIDRIAVISCHS